MRKEKLVRKNLDLLADFMKHVFEHPEVLDRIPKDAELIFLPVNEPDICEENRKIAERLRNDGKVVVLVRMSPVKIPSPELELMGV